MEGDVILPKKYQKLIDEYEKVLIKSGIGINEYIDKYICGARNFIDFLIKKGYEIKSLSTQSPSKSQGDKH